MDEIERAVWIEAGCDPDDPRVLAALEVLKPELWLLGQRVKLRTCTSRDDH